uniref:Uncharacterized protein n=1 Tax=Siphoviridae sp. ctSP74 TaxID=2826343 RepID=A0A8S5NQE9_9CAUD|nr:MAG TPA: hypothetical protein [Siphoviridae sp. ctSP74]
MFKPLLSVLKLKISNYTKNSFKTIIEVKF